MYVTTTTMSSPYPPTPSPPSSLAQLLYAASHKLDFIEEHRSSSVVADDIYDYVEEYPDSVQTLMTIVSPKIIQRWKDSRRYHRYRILDGYMDAGTLVLPIHYLMLHEDKIIKFSNWTHQEVRDMCVFLLWKYPAALLLKDNASRPNLNNNINIDDLESSHLDKEKSSITNYLNSDVKTDTNSNVMHSVNAYLFTKPIWAWLRMVYMMNPVFQFDDKKSQNITDFSHLFDNISSQSMNLIRSNSKVYSVAAKGDDGIIPYYIDTYFPSDQLTVSNALRLLLEVLSDMIDRPVKFAEDDLHDLDSNSLEVLSGEVQLLVDENIDIVINVIVSVPGFLKTLLYCYKSEGESVFGLSIIKHVVLESESNLSYWLMHLLQYSPEHSLIFFQILSSYLNDNVNGLIEKKNVEFDEEDVKKPKRVQFLLKKRDKLFDSLLERHSRDIFVSISFMNLQLQYKAVDIRSIQHLVDMEYSQATFPFVFMVSDVIFQLLSFLSFQMAAVFFLAEWNVIGYVGVSQIALYSTLYFLSREIFQVFSIMTKQELLGLCSFWNIIDWTTIALVLTAYFIIDNTMTENSEDWIEVPSYVRHTVAFATIVQGLKFVGSLRLCNINLAVFIVSLIQIMKDIRYFLLVLAIVIISFSQVLLSVLAGDNPPEPCSEKSIDRVNEALQQALLTNDPTEVQVALDNVADYRDCFISTHYKRSYEMLIGQWDTDVFRSDLSYIMFFVFTFFVSLIMLNILIAIASDSYAQAKENGPIIFRLERLLFTAEMSSVELMLQEADHRGRVIISHIIVALIFALAVFYSNVYSISTLPSQLDGVHHMFISTMVPMTVFVILILTTLCLSAVDDRTSKKNNDVQSFRIAKYLLWVPRFIASQCVTLGRFTLSSVEEEPSNDGHNHDQGESNLKTELELLKNEVVAMRNQLKATLKKTA